MRLFDKIAQANQRHETIYLKGHAKLIMEDVRDGSQKIIESDNIMTNALSSILNHNHGMLNDFRSLMPFKNFYGGCLLFADEITANANNFNPPNQLVNPLTAHAGDIAPALGYTGTRRGSPVTNAYDEGDDYFKQVWMWDNTQGIGFVRTVCLCGKELGNMSLMPADASLNGWASLAMSNTIGRTDCTNLSRTEAMKRPISIDSNGKTGKAIYWTSSAFEEITVKHDWNAYGVMRTNTDWTEVSSRTTDQIRSFTRGKSSLFEDDDYYYLYEVTSSTSLKIDKINKSTFAVTQADISYSGISLHEWNVSNANGAYWFMNVPRWAYDGTYLYLPNSSANGFYAVNPNNSSDKFALDGTVSLYIGVASITGKTSIRPIVINEGLIFGENYIINGDTVYQTAMTNAIYQTDTTGRTVYLDTIREGASVYGMPYRGDDYDYMRGQGDAYLQMTLNTINVLPAQMEHKTNQTMRLEYTCTEV